MVPIDPYKALYLPKLFTKIEKLSGSKNAQKGGQYSAWRYQPYSAFL